MLSSVQAIPLQRCSSQTEMKHNVAERVILLNEYLSFRRERIEGLRSYAKCHHLVALDNLRQTGDVCLSPSHEISDSRQMRVVQSQGEDHVWSC